MVKGGRVDEKWGEVKKEREEVEEEAFVICGKDMRDHTCLR